MGNKASRMRGFTLIASLLVLILLSGIAIGLMFLVNSQQHMGSNDTEDNLAYYGAESGMEKMTADLSAVYSSKQAPNFASDIAPLATPPYWPTAAMVGPGMTYNNTIKPLTAGGIATPRLISSGPEEGLHALVIPMQLQVSATRTSGASVNIFRTVEVALIPVFQFGVFSDSDVSYFAGPRFAFQGRIHTNGNLFLAANNGPLIADAQITAFGEIIRDRLANNVTGYNGSVYAPSSPNACTPFLAGGTPAAGSACKDIMGVPGDAENDASWSGGIPPLGSANAAGDPTPYATWIANAGKFAPFLMSGSNGAKRLSLPFVQSNNALLGSANQQIQIIRRGLATDTVPVQDSKLYNKAAIRILLADTQAGLHTDGSPQDGNDIDLTGGNDPHGLQIQQNWVGPGPYTRVAMANAGPPIQDPAWTAAPSTVPPLTIPNPQNLKPAGAPTLNWNLINGWIRVEYLNNAAAPAVPGWVGITKEWLGYGFARGATIPTTPVIPFNPATSNTVHSTAILILQELKPGAPPINDTAAGTFESEYSWYPINFWDPREGLPRDGVGALVGTEGNANGIMNAVELDVGNLNLWLQHTGPYAAGAGNLVNSTAQNGYVLYFSDRRGMEINPNDPNGASVDGEYGFEDVVNSASGTGTPDTILQPATAGYNIDRGNGVSYSPEDPDQNGLLDTWGAADVGNGFPGTASTAGNPYQAVDCQLKGMQNIVTGARHVLKLVDGSLGNLPMSPPVAPAVVRTGGFTVASENPVYVEGNYNSDAADTVWVAPTYNDDLRIHAAAAIIADSVTLLSNPPPPGAPGAPPAGWTDQNSMANPLNLGKRVPLPTYFRAAVAAGKSMNFPHPAGTNADFGTDGGVHNFLRLLENWSNAGGVGLFYRGSLVSLYYSEYNTGTFKCCNEVYGAPLRNFFFDTDFQNPNNLPPGTPMLQDINNLSERQDFTPN